VNFVVHSYLIRNEIKQILTAYVDSLELEEEANQRDRVVTNAQPIPSALLSAMDHASLATTALSIKHTSALDGVAQAVSMARAMGGSTAHDEHSSAFSDSEEEVEPFANGLATNPSPPTMATVAEGQPQAHLKPSVVGLAASTSPATSTTLAVAESTRLVEHGETRFTAEMQLQMRHVFGDAVVTQLLQKQPQVVHRDPDDLESASLQSRAEHLTRAEAMRMHQSPATFDRPLMISAATKSAELLVVAEANADGTFQRGYVRVVCESFCSLFVKELWSWFEILGGVVGHFGTRIIVG
jgi:hypothetical protein